VPRVVHDRVRVDRPRAADRLELELGGHAPNTRRVRRMLEVAAGLAALQREHALLGRVPEGFRPLVGNGDGAGGLAPVSQRQGLVCCLVGTPGAGMLVGGDDVKSMPWSWWRLSRPDP